MLAIKRYQASVAKKATVEIPALKEENKFILLSDKKEQSSGLNIFSTIQTPKIKRGNVMLTNTQRFANTLMDEIKAEIQFCIDVAAKRTQPRKDSDDKVLAAVTTALSITFGLVGIAGGFPGAGVVSGVGQGLAQAGGAGVQHVLDEKKKARNAALTELFIGKDISILNVHLSQFAKRAALRYEYIINEMLSDTPVEGILPFARIGARRIINYLHRIARATDNVYQLDKRQHDSFEDLLLAGLIEGHSGKGTDNVFSDNQVKGRNNHDISVEGLFSRPAMRELCIGSQNPDFKTWPLFYRLDAQHKHGIGKADIKNDWGSVKLQGEGEKKAKRITMGPKYGFIYVDKKSHEQQYAYGEQFPESLSLQLQHWPSVYFAKADDIGEYHKHAEKCRNDQTEMPSFLKYIQEKESKATNNHRKVTQIWVHGQDFSNKEFTCGDYSNVDFFGCNFNGVRLKGTQTSPIKFNRAILTCVSAPGLQCDHVEFNQADWSCSDLTGANFGEIAVFGTTWFNTNLDKLTQHPKMENQEKQRVLQAEASYDKSLQAAKEIIAAHEVLESEQGIKEKEYHVLSEQLKKLATDNPKSAKLSEYIENNVGKLLSSQQQTRDEYDICLREKKELMSQLDEKKQQLAGEPKPTEDEATKIQEEITKISKDLTEIEKLIPQLNTQIEKYSGDYKKLVTKVNNFNESRGQFQISVLKDADVHPGAHVEITNVQGQLFEVVSKEMTPILKEIVDEMLEIAKNYDYEIDVASGLKAQKNARVKVSDVKGTGVVLKIGDKEVPIIAKGVEVQLKPKIIRLISDTKKLVNTCFPEERVEDDELESDEREKYLKLLNKCQCSPLTEADIRKIEELKKDLEEMQPEKSPEEATNIVAVKAVLPTANPGFALPLTDIEKKKANQPTVASFFQLPPTDNEKKAEEQKAKDELLCHSIIVLLQELYAENADFQTQVKETIEAFKATNLDKRGEQRQMLEGLLNNFQAKAAENKTPTPM